MTLKHQEGLPLPLGATRVKEGINFALFSKHATKVYLWIKQGNEEFEIALDPKKNRKGEVWHILVENLKAPFLYGYRLDGPRSAPFYFHPEHILSDPYAKLLQSDTDFAKEHDYAPKGVFFDSKSFDWQMSKHPRHKMEDLIIYEMHVRGFTEDPSSRVRYPGKYLGIIEKIPYLKKLGITAVELMPVQEFHECGYQKNNPLTKKRLCNYWGYSTVNYFMPMSRYATSYETSIDEFKTMVRELHKAGIEVIIDIVFNHTAEKGKEEALFSFMGIDHAIYYMLDQGKHRNFSGCGHTLNVNHPVVRSFIKEVLHYWVAEMHVDGFRFDLATILNRDMSGKLLDPSPLIEEISLDPLLSTTKLIAEPWDLDGYQLGGFISYTTRWSEWNGRYRDSLRSFLKGDKGSKNSFAGAISGSHDLFPQRTPTASINYVTSHDGFSLMDLVSYNTKHNEANGENNQDGNNHTFSWNSGVEGDTDDPDILSLRERRCKNLLVALLISRGVPMLTMGDEYGHTKKGNNNTWCQDNELSWFNWDTSSPLTEFLQKMINLRKKSPLLHKDSFYEDTEVIWHGLKPSQANWDDDRALLALSLKGEDEHLYIAFNATHEAQTFILPEANNKRWHLLVDTFASSPNDFLTNPASIDSERFLVQPYSTIILKLN